MSQLKHTSSKRDSNARSAVDWTPTLVARLRAGDAKTGELLTRLYHHAMVRFCFGYLGNLDDAEDAVQDVFLKVHRSTSVPDHFRIWLYRIARNHCLNARRDRQKRRDNIPLPGDSQMPATRTGQLTRLVNREQRSRIGHLLAALPGQHAELLRLRYIESLSRAEIAEILELSRSIVKSRLFEALKQLRKHTKILD